MNINIPQFLKFPGKNYAIHRRLFVKHVATMLIYMDRIDLAEQEPNEFNVLRVTKMATCCYGIGYASALFRDVSHPENWSGFVMAEVDRFRKGVEPVEESAEESIEIAA